MVDYGIVLGLLGVASGVASLTYSRSQVVAARRQAEEATRATLLESNREISVRLQQIRSRFFKVPGIDDELQKSRPEIKEVVDSVGGGDVYAFWRDVIEHIRGYFRSTPFRHSKRRALARLDWKPDGDIRDSTTIPISLQARKAPGIS